MIPERRSILSAVVITAAFTTELLAIHPFAHLRHGLVWLAGVGREGAAVQNVWKDPTTQEVSHGQYPRSGLEHLRAQWHQQAAADIPRVVLIGNSQTMAMVLADDEEMTGASERTYPDLAVAKLRENGHRVAVYLLPAPNMSYMEALFYVDYLLSTADLRPGRVILQLNYESFRKSGIRDGMLELLSEPAFLGAAREEARRPVPYAATFQSAIDRFAARQVTEDAASEPSAGTTRTGLIEPIGIGNRIEKAARQRLAAFSIWQDRGKEKSDLLQTLYLLRVYVLRITPTTKRSIGGATLAENQSAVERIGALCREHQIELVFFNAPANPRAPLYRRADDRLHYHDLVGRLGREYGAHVFDFEDAIPQRAWGSGEDGPDPIHFGRAGHRLFANLMVESGVFGRTN
jgi:hypothetical protein